MQAIRAGRGPLTLTALVTLALGGAQLLHHPARPKAVDTVVHVELRSVPTATRTGIDRVPIVPPEPPRCCACIMEDNAIQAEKERALAKAKRRAASRSHR